MGRLTHTSGLLCPSLPFSARNLLRARALDEMRLKEMRSLTDIKRKTPSASARTSCASGLSVVVATLCAKVRKDVKPSCRCTDQSDENLYRQEDDSEKYEHTYRSCHYWHRIYTPAQPHQWERGAVYSRDRHIISYHGTSFVAISLRFSSVVSCFRLYCTSRHE
ncbi:hypothetical protein EDD36DRAFT_248019 [Exophiala viscosa]|uniref:Uncharacterized protein n=1 Tax=Exophiala viscosa TaxID=2486360 RepID=A0AAN6ICY2_9EURO|nr:hypothetical protein EDD36DRAFT_248019 [Exophiala viscosa]